MSNRRFNQFRYSLEKGVTDIIGKVSFGSSGAPTLVSGRNKGIVSITRNSAGNYTIVFGTSAASLDTYQALLNLSHSFYVASGVPAAPGMYISDNSIATSSASITIVFIAYSGSSGAAVATDPGSGEAVHLNFTFRNSSAL